eukprot:s180_g36.t1
MLTLRQTVRGDTGDESTLSEHRRCGYAWPRLATSTDETLRLSDVRLPGDTRASWPALGFKGLRLAAGRRQGKGWLALRWPMLAVSSPRPVDCIYLRRLEVDELMLLVVDRNSDRESTIVYNVLGLADGAEKVAKTERMAAAYQEAHRNYRSQNFKKASELFQKYAKLSKKLGPQEPFECWVTTRVRESPAVDVNADDPAALLMQNRSKFYLENPPSRSWDGVWDQAND